jgi:hypothetical protein
VRSQVLGREVDASESFQGLSLVELASLHCELTGEAKRLDAEGYAREIRAALTIPAPINKRHAPFRFPFHGEVYRYAMRGRKRLLLERINKGFTVEECAALFGGDQKKLHGALQALNRSTGYGIYENGEGRLLLVGYTAKQLVEQVLARRKR